MNHDEQETDTMLTRKDIKNMSVVATDEDSLGLVSRFLQDLQKRPSEVNFSQR